MSLKLTINGQQFAGASPGQTILEAAEGAGVEIPTLCHHPDLSPVGSCRLCLVAVEGLPGLVPACTFLAADGMAIQTETAELVAERRTILELLLADYHDAGYTPGDRPPTELERWLAHYQVQQPTVQRGINAGPPPRPRYVVDSDPNSLVWVDLNKCILCTRCVRACSEVQGCFVWGVEERGRQAKIVAGADTTMLAAGCESCGACAAYCPTGALDHRPALSAPKTERLVRTTCSYCGVGCQFDLHVSGERVTHVSASRDAPVNGMSLCVKGRYGYGFVHHPDRLLRPRVRQYLLERDGRRPASDRGPWVEVDWDTALDLVADRLADVIRKRGGDAVGIFASAKCSNEENYLMQKLARQVIGTHNVDHCARLCHSSTVAGLAMALGSGAMSNSMDDVAGHAAAMLIIGSNTTEQHPVFGAMIRQAVLRRGMKLVVADPREIDITRFATLHVRQRPGSDVALVNGLMHIILANNWHDEPFLRERCEGFDEFAQSLERYPPRVAAELTGVPEETLYAAAELLARNRPMAVVWAMGITQHTTGVLNVLSLANLQMLLGNLGVPGGGVNPLRGQNNVQGACDMGALPNVFTGYQAVTDEQARAKFYAAWALKPGRTPQASLGRAGQAGLTVTEMVDAAGDGRLGALFILGENPTATDPDSNHVQQALAAAEFVVLEEIFPSDTASYADVLLPGCTFAERTGTFTNTERRVQLFRQAIAPLGDARPDWQILCDLARRLLDRQGRRPAGPWAGWQYRDAAEIMEEVAALTPSYAGISHARLERGERLQWPVPSVDAPGTPILHTRQFTRGKGKLHVVDHLPPAELPDADYPLLMTTGRVLYHWHAGEMTRRVAGLVDLYGAALVEVSADDAARLGVADDQPIRVRSRRGETLARAVVTSRVSPGLVFGNFHFPGPQNINNVTIAALDPVAKIPEYKVCAVQLEPLA